MKNKQILQIKKSLILYLLILLPFSVSRLSIAILYFPFFKEIGISKILLSFISGLRFDLASTTVLFFIPIVLLNIPFQFATKWYWHKIIAWLIFPFAVSIGLFLVGDVIYFDFVKRHISYELFLMNQDDATTVAAMSYSIFLPYFISFLVMLIAYFFIWKRIAITNIYAVGRFRWRFTQFIVLFISLFVIGRGGIGYKPITIIDAFASGDTKYGNLMLNGIFSVSHSMLKSKDVNHHHFKNINQAYEAYYDEDFPNNKKYPIQKQYIRQNEKQYNLVFILVESLSFKYLDSFSGNSYGVTPVLDKLSKESMIFTNFYAAGQRSVEGLQATLTGIPSIIGLPTIGIGLLSRYSKLGKMAANNGYSTIFVQSLKRRSFRVDAIAGSTGFEEFYGMEDMPILLDYRDSKEAKYGWDYETLMFSFEKMKTSSKPFLNYIVTSTTHTPYPNVPDHLVKYPHSKNKEGGFLNTLSYTDWSIGELIKKAKQQPWFDDTIFIITADHALAHYQSGTFKERFHIPLIIYAPKIIKPAKITTTASQLSIFPTIIEKLQFEGHYSTIGTSLLQQNPGSTAIIREGSVIGIISDKGYLRHSLSNRLETGKWDQNNKIDYKKMEQKLLAADQITFELMQDNIWAE